MLCFQAFPYISVVDLKLALQFWTTNLVYVDQILGSHHLFYQIALQI